MNITRHDWWAMPIWQFDIPSETSNPTLLESECRFYEQERAGRPRLNFGWHNTLNDQRLSNTKQLLLHIEQFAPAWFDEMGISDTYSRKLENFWININSPGRFNKPHLHPNSVFTGVYYVKAGKNCGNIVFHNSSDREFALQTYIDKPNQFSMTNVNYEPAVGKVLVFPSWLQHSVDSNMSNTDRISISFQFGELNR